MVDSEIILQGMLVKYIVGTLPICISSSNNETKQAASNKYEVARSVTRLNYIHKQTYINV